MPAMFVLGVVHSLGRLWVWSGWAGSGGERLQVSILGGVVWSVESCQGPLKMCSLGVTRIFFAVLGSIVSVRPVG